MDIAEQATVGAASRTGEPRRVRRYAVALCLAALAAGAVLLASGAVRPDPGPVLLLAVAAALCINRVVLFPTEHASTAEAAVILAAVVGFRHDAVYLGPLLVGVLVGPLDTVHWEQRSFVRMAYNAGNRGLAALAASAAFVGCRDALGSAPVSRCIVVAVAGAAFLVVDLVLSTVLLHLVGEPVHDAARHVIEVDALTLPVAWYGALAALLLAGVGWWAVALALVPVAFVPELVIARAHWRAGVARDLAALLAVVALMAALALILPVPDAGTVIALTTIGVLAGGELVVDRRTILSPLVALLVVTATVVAGRDEVAFAAALVAVTAVAVSWWCTGRASRPALLGVVAVALGAALVAAALGTASPRTLAGSVVGAAIAAMVVQVVAIVTAAERRHVGARVLWTVPLIAAAFGWARAWRTLGPGGAAVFVIAGFATLAAVAWWGAPAWRSRRLAPATRGAAGRWLGALFAAVAATTIATSVVALAAQTPSTATTAAWIAAGLGASLTAMVAMGVHQWRLAPRPRARGLVALVLTGVLFASVVPRLLLDGSPAGPVAVVVLTLVLALQARPTVARARAVNRHRDRVRSS